MDYRCCRWVIAHDSIAVLTVLKRALDMYVNEKLGWYPRSGNRPAHCCDNVGGASVRVGNGEILALQSVCEALRSPGRLFVGIFVERDFLSGKADQEPSLGLRPEHQPAVLGLRVGLENEGRNPSQNHSRKGQKQRSSLRCSHLVRSLGSLNVGNGSHLPTPGTTCSVSWSCSSSASARQTCRPP